MGILDNFFKKKQNNSLSKTSASFGQSNDMFFVPFDTNLLNSETFLTCLRVNSSFAAKLKIQSVREKDGQRIHDYPTLDYLLQVAPNPIMNAATLYEKISNFYDLYNNAFIYIEKDSAKKDIKHLWSIDPQEMQIAQAENKEWLCKFTIDGISVVEPYSNIIHIARDVISSDIWGTNHKTITKILNLIDLNYQGIEKAIKTSGVLKYIAKMTTKLSKEALKKHAEEFTENYLNVDPKSNIGMAYVDSMTEITPVPERTQKYANFREAEELDNKVYNYLLCPKAIVDGTANADVKSNYIESRLGPFMVKLEQEMNRKLFSRTEYGHNNRIKVSHDYLKYATMAEKQSFITTTRELGIMTVGMIGDILDIDVPIAMKDKVLVSQNYIQSLENDKKEVTPNEPKNEPTTKQEE